MRWFIMIALGFFCSMAAGAEPPKEEPISARLIARFAHSNQGKNDADSIGEIVEIHFSPDGKRLMAGDYPGGAVNVWDISSGKRLAVMETGAGYRVLEYFAVSPDWKTIYSATNGRGRKSNKIEVAGKAMISYSFDDAVQVFDVESGKLSESWQHSPAREIKRLP
jgi:WD40 repeat protein